MPRNIRVQNQERANKIVRFSKKFVPVLGSGYNYVKNQIWFITGFFYALMYLYKIEYENNKYNIVYKKLESMPNLGIGSGFFCFY